MKKQNTKQMRQNYALLQRTSATSLRDVYNSWSYNKEKAYNYCRELYSKYNGENFRILSANTFAFSVGFIGTIDGQKAFFYITKSDDRYMLLD